MRRIRLYLVGALLVVGFALVWWVWPDDPVHARFLLVKQGMTRADVEGLMGEPSAAHRDEGDVGEVTLIFNGNNGRGFVVFSHDTELATAVEWRTLKRDPIWLRFWNRLTGVPEFF